FAMVLRIWVTGTSSTSAAGATGANVGAARPGAAAAGAAGAATAASTSRLMMRPPGPVPFTLARSIPASRASLRASGDALTRPSSGGTATSSTRPPCARPCVVPTAGVGRRPGDSTAACTPLPACSRPRRRLRQNVRDVLVRRRDHPDHRADRHRLALVDEALAEYPAPARDELHRGLVGLDLGQDVAFLDLVTLFLEPPDELALLHG